MDQLTAAIIPAKDWQVRNGVDVPAYSVPDHIHFDGKPTFFAGNYEEGDKQGAAQMAHFHRWTMPSI